MFAVTPEMVEQVRNLREEWPKTEQYRNLVALALRYGPRVIEGTCVEVRTASPPSEGE